eukprot:scaffold2200_cov413-Prasinococcus_capsulatus_cf.AAC.14
MRVTPDIEFLRDLYRSHGCHFVYFTMLREPLGLQISTYNYHVKDFKFKDETIKDIIDFTTQDITALYLAGTPPSHFNKKAKMGIHGVHQELYAHETQEPMAESLLTEWSVSAGCRTPAMWETVKKEMDRFDVIGFTNQWKATLHVVLLMAGEIDYAPYAYHTDLGQYQACAHSSCVQAKDLSGEELAQLNSLGKGDQWLYDLAQSKFGNLLKLSETAYSDFLQALAMRELSCALMEDIRKLDPMPIEIDRFVVPEPLPPAYVRGDLLAYGCLQKRPHHIRTSFDERDLFECALPSHGSNPGESAAPSPTTVAEFSTMICDRVAFNSIYDHTYVEHCSDFRCSNLQANETFCRRAIDLNNVRACEPTFRRAVDRGQEISYGYFQSPDHKMARRWPVDEPLIQEYEIQQFPSLWPKPITAHHLRLTFCSSEEWMPRDAEGYPRNLDGEELSSWYAFGVVLAARAFMFPPSTEIAFLIGAMTSRRAFARQVGRAVKAPMLGDGCGAPRVRKPCAHTTVYGGAARLFHNTYNVPDLATSSKPERQL